MALQYARLPFRAGPPWTDPAAQVTDSEVGLASRETWVFLMVWRLESVIRFGTSVAERVVSIDVAGGRSTAPGLFHFHSCFATDVHDILEAQLGAPSPGTPAAHADPFSERLPVSGNGHVCAPHLKIGPRTEAFTC